MEWLENDRGTGQLRLAISTARGQGDGQPPGGKIDMATGKA
jgi:hypothetical protein